jgi:hypothetical protein
MDGGVCGAHAQLAVRTRLVRCRGGMVRTERVPGVDGEDVMCEERELRRVAQAEQGERGAQALVPRRPWNDSMCAF